MRRRTANLKPIVCAAWAGTAVSASALAWLLLVPAARADVSPPVPVAGGAGLYMMPAELSDGTFGAWLVDVDRQVLVAYVLDPTRDGRGQLRLVAARQTQFDRRLRDFNTAAPAPREVRRLIELESDNARVRPGAAP